MKTNNKVYCTLLTIVVEKLTENRTIELLMPFLVQQGYAIESFCLGQTRGYDIVAVKNNRKLFVEVKGAKAHNDSPTKKRPFFNSGQIKSHLGKAIIKCLETKVAHPEATIAIAHPEEEQIRSAIAGIIPELNKIGISHYWVSADGTVQLDSYP